MELKKSKTTTNSINQLSFQKTGVQMKRLVALSLVALLILFTACQNEGPVSPDMSGSQKVSKTTVHWIGLPQNADQKLAKSFSTSSLITVAEGGTLAIDESYTSTEGVAVHASSSIYFAPGCVPQDTDITMEIDDQTGVSTFNPHMVFNFPAVLNQTFSGLNLTGINPDNVKLYYLAEDGNYEAMQCDNLIVDVATGTITVVNGKIPHFSLYGYGE